MGFMFGRDDMGEALKLMGVVLAVAFTTLGIGLGLLLAWVL